MVRYAITNRRSGDEDEVERAALGAMAERWSRSGVEYMQLRERGVEAAELRALVGAVVAGRDAGGGAMRVLVHGATEGATMAAMEGGADGVHLPGRFARVGLGERVGGIREEFRRVAGSVAVVSLSCHATEEVRAAGRAGVDLVLFGPVFGKVVDGERVREGVGLAGLREACAVGVPVLALGGVTEETAAMCMEAGAVGVAGIRMFAEGGLPAGAPARRPVTS